jgi:glycosyltransferase involved in cell wall biosynthesis
MPAVAQLVHTLSYGDAITGEVLAINRVLLELGIDAKIYAINQHPLLKGQAENYLALPKDFNGRVILHYSLGSPLNQLFRELSQAQRSLIYHNLTPAKWFDRVNPRIVADIEAGQRELPELCALCDLILSDSEYNAGEIRALGFESQVLELPLDDNKWNEPENPGIRALLRNDPATHLLHVGRLAPNKCIEDIIKCFYFYHYKINRQSKLWLVGIDIDTELYSFSLKRLAQELRVDQAVQFVGCLSDQELKSIYLESDVYLCTSEHEGFCVPVIEAMYFGVPVVAFNSSALPYTMAASGVLMSQKDPALMAEIVNEVATNQELRQRLIGAGKQRVAELSLEQFKSRLKSSLRL